MDVSNNPRRSDDDNRANNIDEKALEKALEKVIFKYFKKAVIAVSIFTLGYNTSTWLNM